MLITCQPGNRKEIMHVDFGTKDELVGWKLFLELRTEMNDKSRG